MKKFIVCLLVLAGCSAALHVDVKEKIVLEYGDVTKLENFTDQKGVSVKEVKNFDGKKLGEQNITVVFVNDDGKESSEEITVTVKDTKLPEIVLHKETVEITEGDAFDGKANVSSVKDPVDGDLPFSDKKDLNKNGYVLNGNVDVHKPGEYKVSVIAFDKNGNKAMKEFRVKVKENKKELPVQTQNNATQSKNGGASGYKAVENTTNTNGSQNNAPNPSQEKTCVVPEGQIGNSGMIFKTEEEAKQWGAKYIEDCDSKGNCPIATYTYGPSFNSCSEQIGWTVEFNYVK